MTTIAYQRVARYATNYAGDYRAQHILSTIGAMIANSWRGQGKPPVAPRQFGPWLDWPDEDDEPLLYDPYGDPLTDGLE